MLAHAISRTSRPIALSTITTGRMCVWAPFGDCENGTTLSRCVASASGRSGASVAQSASVWAAAFASVTPGRGNPCGSSTPARRSERTFAAAAALPPTPIWDAIITGMYTSVS
jgi:hypothetical protein